MTQLAFVQRNHLFTDEFAPAVTENCFTAKLSDLDHPIDFFMGPLWENETDKGFVMTDHVTGERMIFVLRKTFVNDDDETTGWIFENFGRTISAYIVNK